MVSSRSLRQLAAGIALGWLAAACSESLGPQTLANPDSTAAQLDVIEAALSAPAMQSFSALSGEMSPVAGQGAARLLRGTSPELARRPYARSLESAQALRELLPASSSATPAAIFPPAVLGMTFEWDAATGAYQPTARTGAPANGVRFILYAIDPLTRQPSTPLTEVGYVDLTDESAGASTILRVKVVGSGTPGVTYVDYTIGVTPGTNSLALAASGYVTDGTTRLDFGGSFTVTGTATGATVTFDLTLDVNARDIHVRLLETVTLSQTGGTFTINFSLEHGGETVTVSGTITETAAGTSGSITVRVNGGSFASCTVSNETLTCTGAGHELTAAERNALDKLGDVIEDITEAFFDLFEPAENIFGS